MSKKVMDFMLSFIDSPYLLQMQYLLSYSNSSSWEPVCEPFKFGRGKRLIFLIKSLRTFSMPLVHLRGRKFNSNRPTVQYRSVFICELLLHAIDASKSVAILISDDASNASSTFHIPTWMIIILAAVGVLFLLGALIFACRLMRRHVGRGNFSFSSTKIY